MRASMPFQPARLCDGATARRRDGCRCVGSRNQVPVSIHAPTRGATVIALDVMEHTRKFQPTRRRAHAGRDRHELEDRPGVSRVSTHAPTRGATIAGVSSSSVSQWFQPTRPRGARRPLAAVAVVTHEVSIHAPTRGATARCSLRTLRSRGFNPRAHAGRDEQGQKLQGYYQQFQPTRPRGARRPVQHPGDPHQQVSTHAPTRGATGSHSPQGAAMREFQPTRPRGARQHLPR